MQRAEGVRVAHPLYQAGGDGSHPISALDLWLYRVSFPTAMNLNRLWHSTLPRLKTGSLTEAAADRRFLCFGAICGDLYYASAVWSAPANRCQPTGWLELRRLAVGPDAPRNTPSRMLRIMALLIRQERPDVPRLISYHQTDKHTGGIYRAAGWVEVGETKGGEWDTPARPRPRVQSKAPKILWEKKLFG